MPSKTLYSYTNYKSYLRDRIRAEPREGHGFRRKIATAVNCQLSYISHVLGGDRHFSVEQAEALTRFLGLTADEREYFIWLLEHERAATPGARGFFADLLEKKRDQYFQTQVKVENNFELDMAAMSQYFSNYLYASVQSLITIDGFRTPQAIASRLGVDLNEIGKVLEFLKNKGLVSEDRGRLSVTSKNFFLDRDSPFILQHHSVWRMRAIQSVARRRTPDQHLSFVITISENDAKTVRRKIAEFVDELQEIIRPSPEEKLMALSLDFFEV